MSRRRNRGGRRLRVALASAIAALGVGAVGVSSASAATISFDNAFLKISGLADPQNIGVDGNPVDLTGVTYSGGTSGTFTVPPASFDFPTFTGTVDPGVPLTVTVTPQGSFNGNLSATGQLTSSVTNFRADIALGPPINSDCRIEPIPLALGTTNSNAFVADAFDAGSNDPPTNGAITDDWATLPPPTLQGGSSCALIAGLTAGCGGLWLSNGTPATPTLATGPGQLRLRRTGDARTAGEEGEEVQEEEEEEGQERRSAAAKCKKKKKKKKK